MSEYPKLGYSNFMCFWIAGSCWRSLVASFQPDVYRTALRLLVEARKKAGVTQEELASRIRKRQTFVSKFELGERRLDVAEFLRVSRAIGIDPYRLLKAAERSVGP